MYAAGKIPGSFFRREGRPSTDAILTCRLIDRPLRPTFTKGLRNEVQVVITVLALNPDHQYDVLAINAATASTQISGLPFSGPIGGVRVALIDGQWVAFPNFSDAERSVFDMVVAGRVVKNIEVRRRRDHDGRGRVDRRRPGTSSRTRATRRRPRRSWPRASRPPRSSSRCCARPRPSSPRRSAKPVQDFPIFLDYQDDVYAAVEAATSADLDRCRCTIAGKQEREDADRRDQGRRHAPSSPAPRRLRGSREGDLRCLPLRAEEADPSAHPARQGPHRRPRPRRHPRPRRRGRGPAARARLGDLRARRDPDHGCHHAEHAAHGAAARHPLPGDAQALHAQLQLPALQHR